MTTPKEYHVSMGLFGIYAGITNKKGDKWLDKTDVTDEAINAVAGYMADRVKKGENSLAYALKRSDGKYITLKVGLSDKCPELELETKEKQDD